MGFLFSPLSEKEQMDLGGGKLTIYLHYPNRDYLPEITRKNSKKKKQLVADLKFKKPVNKEDVYKKAESITGVKRKYYETAPFEKSDTYLDVISFPWNLSYTTEGKFLEKKKAINRQFKRAKNKIEKLESLKQRLENNDGEVEESQSEEDEKISE